MDHYCTAKNVIRKRATRSPDPINLDQKMQIMKKVVFAWLNFPPWMVSYCGGPASYWLWFDGRA
jgi:hypothetical protein